MLREKKKHRIKPGNVIVLFFMLIFFIGFIYSIINLFIWKNDNNKNEEQIINLEKIVNVTEQDDLEATEIIPDSEHTEEEVYEFNPYLDYTQMKLIDVDFSLLKQINSDTIGWIQLVGTNINYPFVQAKDNSYYLDHTFDKSYNQAGWIFLDYRNNYVNNDKNTIIYGHSLKSGLLFGALKEILSDEWQNNSNYHIVKVSTEKENSLWQVFSIYTIPTTSDYIKVDFKDNKEFKDFTNILINRSIYDFKTLVNENDKILTLSSCYIDSNSKIVLHAKLIKRIEK